MSTLEGSLNGGDLECPLRVSSPVGSLDDLSDGSREGGGESGLEEDGCGGRDGDEDEDSEEEEFR